MRKSALAAESTERCVALAREAGELALELHERHRRAANLTAAREMLDLARKRQKFPGACEASLALARLEARFGSAADAATLAHVTASRSWGGDSRECISRARAMFAALDFAAPTERILAEAVARAESGDPSIGAGASLQGALAAGEAAPTLDFSLEAEGGSGAEPATLEEILIRGGEAKDSRHLRIALAFDRSAAFRREFFPAQDGLPNRLMMHFPLGKVGAAVPSLLAIDRAGVVRARVARDDEENELRLTFDLENGVGYSMFMLPSPFRVVIDFENGSSRNVVARDDRERVLVLDPGHGANDFGARSSNGLVEARLTLDLAKRTRAILARRMPLLRVLLTREEDVRLQLEDRVAFANGNDADLFVSIHLNDADDPVEHGGVTTFVLDVNDPNQATKLAARENGTSLGSVSGMQRLLAGLYRADQVRASRQLADFVHRGTLAGGRRALPSLPDRGVKSALFYVLVGATMPAVLLEASFLTEPTEMRALATESYREHLAEGIAEGIARYVESLP